MDKSQIIALILAGQAGAHAAALAFPDKSLGRIRNALTGLAGGGLGTAILERRAFTWNRIEIPKSAER